jgi:TolB protein
MKYLLFMMIVCSLAVGDVYITVSGANVKRAKLAVGQVYPLPDNTAPDAKLASDLREQIRSDLNFINLFDFLSESLFVSLDKPQELAGIRYEDWATLNTAFVLKLGYKVDNGNLLLEASLFDVPGTKKIFQRKYQYPAKNYPRLVHALSEDIMKELTGERGLFFSRLLMVCKDLKARRSSYSKEVYIVDADGSNLTQLTYDKTLTLSPAWSHDAKSILYTQYETRAFGKIVKRGTVLKRHFLLTGDRKVLSAKDGMNSGAAWSPKGDKIALTLSYTGHPEIYFMNPAGGEAEPFSRYVQLKKISGEGFQAQNLALLFDVEPRWSPDGSKLVFSSARSGHPMIYTVDVATKVSTQLTFAGVYNATPDWSPKGDKIVFSAQRSGEGNFDLYVIDPDGNNLQRVTNGERLGRRRVNSENATWAPTGRHLAFANSETGNYAVYVMTLDGTVKRRISPEGKECTEPAWGPPEG